MFSLLQLTVVRIVPIYYVERAVGTNLFNAACTVILIRCLFAFLLVTVSEGLMFHRDIFHGSLAMFSFAFVCSCFMVVHLRLPWHRTHRHNHIL